MIRAIVFDFGGVILKHRATLVKDILKQLVPGSEEIIYEIWERNKLDLNTGKATSDQFINEINKSAKTRISNEKLKERWLELYKKEANKIDWELLEYIKKLKEKYKIYLFTDTIDIHDEYNKTRGVYEGFDKVYKSYKEGIAKLLGRKAYKFILKKIKVKPDECLFIDDLEKNVKIAKDVGMDGIIYQDLKQLKNEFLLKGIKI